MSGRKLLVILAYVLAFVICDVPMSSSTSGDEGRRDLAAAAEAADGKTAVARSKEVSAVGVPQHKVETSMATAERLEGNSWWPTKGTAPLEAFVGTAQCARCHAKITTAQLTTPMAQAASSATDSAVLRQHARISRQMGRYVYTISRSDSGSNYSVGDGVTTISQPLAWAFGLGTKGQTYVYTRGGLYYESRMSFYQSLQGLDLTTGHSNTTPHNLEDAMGRALDASSVTHCFGCHTTASTTLAGFDPTRLTMGVACESCHGPGAEHVELMDDGEFEEGRSAIFNPAKLSPVALVDFCGACHRTLNDVYEMGATGVSNVRFQPYRLENSKCWGDGDARLACTACHDPHQPVARDVGSYDEKCLTCHAGSAAMKVTRERPGKACPVARKDCTTCHMPRVKVPLMHAPFVDHRIRIVRASENYPE
jgi:Cytochrome c554 and c-prime